MGAFVVVLLQVHLFFLGWGSVVVLFLGQSLVWGQNWSPPPGNKKVQANGKLHALTSLLSTPIETLWSLFQVLLVRFQKLWPVLVF